MKGEGIGITCNCCNKEYILLENGKLESVNGDTDYEFVSDWYKWERECVRDEIKNGDYLLDIDVDIMILGSAGAFVRDFQSLAWNGKKIFMMHGDNYPIFRQTALDNNVELAISGHTHIAGVTKEKSTVFLNPGSTTLPKSHDAPSAALLTNDEIKIISLNNGTVLKVETW